MRTAAMILLALLGLAPAVPAQQNAEDLYDDLYVSLLDAYRRFPKDTSSRDALEQAARTRFTAALGLAELPQISHEANFERLLGHLGVARRYDIDKRPSTRRHLAEAAQEIFDRQLNFPEEAGDLPTYPACFESLLAHLRRSRIMLGNRHDLRGYAERAADRIFGRVIAGAVDPGGVDYGTLYTRNQRLIDNQFPVPTPEQEQRDPKLAELRLRNQNANLIAKNANRQVLDMAVRK